MHLWVYSKISTISFFLHQKIRTKEVFLKNVVVNKHNSEGNLSNINSKKIRARRNFTDIFTCEAETSTTSALVFLRFLASGGNDT